MTQVFFDDFGRTVATGLGTSPDTTVWHNTFNNIASVVPGYATVAVDDEADYAGHPLIMDGEIEFDFWVGSNLNDGGVFYRVDGQDVLVSAPNNRTFLSIQVYANGDGSTYFVTTANGNSFNFPVNTNTWYRIRYTVDEATAAGIERVKVWKAALTEPSSWDITGPVIVFPRAPLSAGSIVTQIAGTGSRFTNLRISTDHVDTVIWDPTSPHFTEPGPKPHDVPCVVKIEVGTVDVTDLVIIDSAQFESAANGQVGTCEFWVKDLNATRSFATGKPITLKLDDVVQWRGFVASVGRKYAFDVDRVDGAHPTLTPRFLVVRGNDINILFEKRFVYNKADPTKHTPIFAQHTDDNNAVLTLGSSYLDLAGDGISTSGVTHVGDISPDRTSYVFVPGMTWGEAMRAIAQLPGALFYIDPDKVLRYVDVDVVTAPWGVSDTPAVGGPTAPDGPYGIRDVTIIKDGTALATDALVWGAGLGSTDMHFGRYISPVFETIHGGKWQWADYREDLYKDVSLVKRAQSYVAGSPSNHRGHQDDATGCEFTLFKRGLRVGQVISVQVQTFNFAMTLPIRRMRVSFAGAQRQSDGTFKWFVRFWVNASHIIDDPWSNAEYPVPLNYRKEPNCHFVPRIDACTGDGWTGAYYDPFDRSWTRTGAWGDPGCGAWGNPINFTLVSSRWISPGPGPWCIVFASNGSEDLSFQDGSLIGSSTRPEAMNGSFSVDFTASGTVSASAFAADRNGVGDSVNLGWGGNFPYVIRIQRVPGNLLIRMWKQVEPEPERWSLIVPETYNVNTVAGFQSGGALLMGSDFQLTTRFKPGPISIATKVGWGWVYYTDYSTGVPADFVSTYSPYVWQSRFWPAGTFPVNPDIVGAAQPIDAACTSLSVPLFARSNGGDHTAASFNSRKLYDLHWAWNSDNGLAGTTQADGRMLVRDHYFAGFLAPRGATHVTVTARVYINAPETGAFSLGSQPGPTGEGGIDWELWDVSPGYDGTATDDTIDASHTTIASGTLSDYNYWSDPISIYQDITFDRAISGGQIFQLGGKITNTDSNLINTHGPADSSAVNSGGRRVLELKIINATVKFDWDPTACGPAEPTVAGYQQQAVNCKTGNPFCEVPKFLASSTHTYETLHDYVNDSLIVYVDGKRKIINVDYTETDPLIGHFDYLPEAGDISERMSVCYQVRDHQVFPLPKADPHFNKHPGYTGSPEDYHPKQVEQLGWGTALDGYNCTCASACDYLDAVTYGAQTATPPQMRAAQSDQSGGISLADAAVALATYGITLHVHTGASFTAFDAALDAGPVMMAGLYSQIPRGFNSQLNFLGGHSMMALCWSASKKAILVYDPLNTAPIWMPRQVVRNYMEAFTASLGGSGCDYGATI